MKKFSWKAGLLGALTLLSIAPVAQAAEEAAWGPWTAGATLTTDYRFRGISNSDRDPAAQGYVNYEHASGFFGNIWFSTIDFQDESTYDSNIEIDLTAGYNHAFSDVTSAGIKGVYYWYADADAPTGQPDYDYFELIANVGHDFGKVAVSGELAWSPDFFAETGDSVALTGGLTYPIADAWWIFDAGVESSAHLGYQWVDVGEDYLYYDLGVSAGLGIFVFDLRWVGTDIDDNDCSINDTCEGGVVFSISAGLPG